jgi:hypothetical protein
MNQVPLRDSDDALWMDAAYRAARGLLPSRRTFFEPLRALLQYLPFESWAHLMEFMLKGLGAEIPAQAWGIKLRIAGKIAPSPQESPAAWYTLAHRTVAAARETHE